MAPEVYELDPKDEIPDGFHPMKKLFTALVSFA